MASMTDEAKAARAKYQREWYKKNPDKRREYMAKYWERKAQTIREKGAKNDITDDQGK